MDVWPIDYEFRVSLDLSTKGLDSFSSEDFTRFGSVGEMLEYSQDMSSRTGGIVGLANQCGGAMVDYNREGSLHSGFYSFEFAFTTRESRGEFLSTLRSCGLESGSNISNIRVFKKR